MMMAQILKQALEVPAIHLVLGKNNPPPDGKNSNGDKLSLGKKGTGRNPVGTLKDPFDQIDQIKDARKKKEIN